MARASKAKPKALAPVEAKVLRRKKVSLATIGRYKEQVLAAYATVLVPEAMEKLRAKMNEGGSRELNTVLKMFSLITPSGPGIVINNNNTATAQAAAAAAAGGKSFDAIARRLHEARSAKTATVDVPPAVTA